MVLDRLEWDGVREKVVIHPRPSKRGAPFGESERLDVLEFLARVLDHVAEPRQQQVRYWGWYSNAARGKRSKTEARHGATEEATAEEATACAELDRPLRHRRLSWARLIKKVYEIDPLLCPYCEAEMKIVAFVVEFSSLCRLLTHLGVPAQHAEPLSRAPPGKGELLYEAVDL